MQSEAKTHLHVPPWPQAGEREAELLRMVLESPQWGGFHPFVTEFEQSFAAYQHSLYGISTFNGTVSLELALAVLGIGAGDEVILPAISFISSGTAIARAGAIPVFADIGRSTFNLDPDRVVEAISPKTKAVMAVHFGGTMCDIARIERICRDYNVLLVEDAAHAQGSEWNGKRAGSFGVAGSFSFQNGKVLCAGEGGILVTSDQDFAERARSVANCGRIAGNTFYEHGRLGTNFRMTGFQAAVLLAQLERLPEQIAQRTANAELLKSLLTDVEGIEWQKRLPEETANSGYLLLGRCGSAGLRDRLQQELSDYGVPCAYYPHALHQNTVWRSTRCRIMPCPVAEMSVTDCFWLGHRVLLAEEETIRAVANLIRRKVRSEATSEPASSRR